MDNTILKAESLRHLEELADKYSQNPDPMLAWRAIKLARLADVSIPDWVVDYLCAVAENLDFLAHAPHEIRCNEGPTYRIEKPAAGNIQSAIAEACGFVPGGISAAENRIRTGARKVTRGAVNPFNDLEYRDLELAALVAFRLLDGKEGDVVRTKPSEAWAAVAVDRGISAGTVRAAWKRFEHTFKK